MSLDSKQQNDFSGVALQRFAGGDGVRRDINVISDNINEIFINLLIPPDVKSEKERQELENKIWTIIEAAGLYGMGKRTKEALDARRRVEDYLVEYVNRTEGREREKINELVELADECNAVFEKIKARDPRGGFKHIKNLKNRYEKLYGKAKEQFRSHTLLDEGLDLEDDPISQFERTVRQSFWINGPENLKENISFLLSDINDRLKNPAEKRAEAMRQKNLARLEKNKEKIIKKSSSAQAEEIRKNEYSDKLDSVFKKVLLSVDKERRGQFEEKIKLITKACGLDGRGRKFVGGLKNFNHLLDDHNVEGGLLDYIRADEDGAEKRIEELVELAKKTDTFIEYLIELDRDRGYKRAREAKKRYDSLRGPAKQELRNECLRINGLDLEEDPVLQMVRGARRTIWLDGPQDVEREINRRWEELNGVPEKLVLKSKAKEYAKTQRQKNLERLQKKKKTNSFGNIISITAASAFEQKQDETKKAKENLTGILSTVQSGVSNLKLQIKTEEERFPGNKGYLEDQEILLSAAAEDYENMRSIVTLAAEEKREVLGRLAEAGCDVSRYATPDEIENLLARGAEDLIGRGEDQNMKDQPLSTSSNRNNDDIEEFRNLFPNICGQIESARAEYDGLAVRYAELKLQNGHLESSARRAESNINRLVEVTGKLGEAKTALEIELAELHYKLENPEETEPLTQSFNAGAKYPPLSQIAAWAKENLDESRIVIAPAALKNAAASQYQDPDLVYRSLKFLAREYWNLQMSGNLGEDERKQIREKHQAGLNRLGLSDAFSRTMNWKTDIGKKYITSLDGREYKLDRHLKKGSGSDDRHHFRIYYTWDSREKRVVVGHMPDHLPTGFM